MGKLEIKFFCKGFFSGILLVLFLVLSWWRPVNQTETEDKFFLGPHFGSQHKNKKNFNLLNVVNHETIDSIERSILQNNLQYNTSFTPFNIYFRKWIGIYWFKSNFRYSCIRIDKINLNTNFVNCILAEDIRSPKCNMKGFYFRVDSIHFQTDLVEILLVFYVCLI